MGNRDKLFRFLYRTLPALALISASVEAAQATRPIMVSMHFHLDPPGLYLPPPHKEPPNRNQRIKEYSEQREAVLWLKNLATEKGFKISAYMTGPYAEFALKLGHTEDFKDFMPGKKHVLGTHLHFQYKSPIDREDFHWSDCAMDPTRPQVPACVPHVWLSNVSAVNLVFKNLGFQERDNKILHGTHRHCALPNFCLTSGELYPNVFNSVGGTREAYHPYRTAVTFDPRLKGNQQYIRDLKTSDFIAVPTATEGVFGVNDNHWPEGWVNGTVQYAKRDYIMEYIEWQYSATWDKTARPWVFELGFHPHEITKDKNEIKGNTFGRNVRETLAEFYTWMNTNFKDSFTYANYYDVADAYVKWEKANPGEIIFKNNIETNPDSSKIDPYAYNGKMRSALKRNNMYYSAMERNPHLEIFEFTNTCNKKAVLVYSKKNLTSFDLTKYFSGPVSKIDMGAKSVTTHPCKVISVNSVPVLFTDAPLTGDPCPHPPVSGFFQDSKA